MHESWRQVCETDLTIAFRTNYISNKNINGGGLFLAYNGVTITSERNLPDTKQWTRSFIKSVRGITLWPQEYIIHADGLYWISIIYKFCILRFETYWFCHFYVEMRYVKQELIILQNTELTFTVPAISCRKQQTSTVLLHPHAFANNKTGAKN